MYYRNSAPFLANKAALEFRQCLDTCRDNSHRMRPHLLPALCDVMHGVQSSIDDPSYHYLSIPGLNYKSETLHTHSSQLTNQQHLEGGPKWQTKLYLPFPSGLHIHIRSSPMAYSDFGAHSQLLIVISCSILLSLPPFLAGGRPASSRTMVLNRWCGFLRGYM